MDITAIDSKNAGIRNEKLVIGLLRKTRGLSQAQICKKTGLGSSTIAYIVGRLRSKELIIERPGQSNKRGAKPVLIDINPAGQYIIGTEINSSYLLIGLFDFNSNLVDTIQVAVDQDHSVEKVISLLEVNIKGLLSKHSVSDEKLAGIGVTLSGSISPDGIVQMSSSLGWVNVPIKQHLSEIFDAPVNVYTTKVRLLAEMNVNPPLKSENIAYLNVANGVGVTAIVDGQLMHGSTNQCGELGHIIIDPDGPLCGCGQRGCLEAHISGPAITKKIKSDVASGAQSVLSATLKDDDAPEAMTQHWKAAIENNDPYAIMLRDDIADKISRAAAIMINLLDPDILILGGYVSAVCSDYFAECIRNRFKSDVYDESSRNIEIIHTRAGQQALIKGVASAVLQEQLQ